MNQRVATEKATTLAEALVACPLCASPNLTLRYQGIRDRLGFVEGNFDFHECERCGSVSLVPLPSEEETSDFYPPNYMVAGPVSSGKVTGLLRRLEWNLLFVPVYRGGARAVVEMTGLRKGRLLEIGCSSGYQLDQFGWLGRFEVCGVDIDGSAVNHAQQKLGLNVVHGTLAEAGFPSSHFDIVILFNVLEHLVDPSGLLEQVDRILRPGGYLAVKTQLIDSIQARIFGRRWVWLHEAPRHVLLASVKGLEELLTRAGMRVLGRRGEPLLENCISVALSSVPDATAALAFGTGRRLVGYLLRLAGMALGLAAIPLVLFERLFGLSGTMVFVAQKAQATDHATSSAAGVISDDQGAQ